MDSQETLLLPFSLKVDLNQTVSAEVVFTDTESPSYHSTERVRTGNWQNYFCGLDLVQKQHFKTEIARYFYSLENKNYKYSDLKILDLYLKQIDFLHKVCLRFIIRDPKVILGHTQVNKLMSQIASQLKLKGYIKTQYSYYYLNKEDELISAKFPEGNYLKSLRFDSISFDKVQRLLNMIDCGSKMENLFQI